MPVTREFLEERAGCIGGSDLKHILSLKPYGCARALWYDKKRVPADAPFVGNRHTERGEAMEPFALAQFAERAKRMVWKPSVAWRLARGETSLGVHVDALQTKDEIPAKAGVVEVKCPTVFAYAKTRHAPDPPNEPALQAQWAMFCHDLDWGHVVLFSADQWDHKSWPVARDERMIVDLRGLANDFLGTLGDGPNPWPKLDYEDARCTTCPWRTTCQGIDPASNEARLRPNENEVYGGGVEITDEGAAELIEQYVFAQRAVKDAKAAFEIVNNEITERFAGRTGTLITSAGQAKLTKVSRKGYTAEVKPTEYLQLRVKPKKEEEHGDIELECD